MPVGLNRFSMKSFRTQTPVTSKPVSKPVAKPAVKEAPVKKKPVDGFDKGALNKNVTGMSGSLKPVTSAPVPGAMNALNLRMQNTTQPKAKEPVNTVQKQTTSGPGAPNKVYGFTIGRVEHGSFEAAVSSMVSANPGTLTVAEAGAFKAVKTLNVKYGTHLRISMRNTPDVAGGKFHAGRELPGSMVLDQKGQFELAFGNYAKMCLPMALQRKLGRPPYTGELARGMAEMFKETGINPGPLVDSLNHGSSNDRRFARYITAYMKRV